MMPSEEKTLPQLKVKLPSGKVLRVPVSAQKQQEAVEQAMDSSVEAGTSVTAELKQNLSEALSRQTSQLLAADATSSVAAENQERLENLMTNQLSMDSQLPNAVAQRVDAAFNSAEVTESVAMIESLNANVVRDEKLLEARIASLLPDVSQTSNYQLPNIDGLSQEQFRAELLKQGLSDSFIDSLIPEFDKLKALQDTQVKSLELLSSQVMQHVSEQPTMELEHVLKPAMVEALKDPVAFDTKLEVEAERLANIKPSLGEETTAAIDKTASLIDNASQSAKTESAAEQVETFLRTSEGKFKAGKAAVLATTAAAVGGIVYSKMKSSPEEKPAPQTVDSGEVSLPAVVMSRS